MSRASRLSGFTTAISGDTDLNVGIVTATQVNTDQTLTFTNLNVTGIATIPVISGVTTIGSDVVVGGATTALVVNGDARVTGILTVGTSSLTLNGDTGVVSGINTINGISYPSTGAFSNRNLIINGAMNVSQRATSTTGITAASYPTVDRFKWTLNSCGTWTSTQESDGPAGFTNSFKMLCTTADASPASSDYAVIQYSTEGQNLQHLNYGTSDAVPIILSFYVKSNKTGTASFAALQPDNSLRQFCTSYTINTANTWEYKTITIPADTSGVINNDSGNGLLIEWWSNSGSVYSGGSNATSWEAADNTNRNANNIGIGQAVNDYLQITGVQLEVGERATPFEHRSYSDELTRCQRYYQEIISGRVNSNSICYPDSSSPSGRVIVNLPLHVTPRVNVAHDGDGTLTQVGDITVNAFPSSTTDNITSIQYFGNIGTLLTMGLNTSATVTQATVIVIRFGSTSGQKIFTLDTDF